MAGAPLGNTNAKRGTEFRQALRKAMAHDSGTASEGMLKIAKQLVRCANEGQQWAIKEIADRVDGRPAQSVEVTGDPDAPLEVRGLKAVYESVHTPGEDETDPGDPGQE